MKVIAVDLDGTLLDSDHQIHPDMQELIQVLRSKGYIFGVATGRPYFSVLSVIPNPKESLDFLICNNGADIYDYMDDSHHEQFPLPGDVVKEIISENLKLGANPILYNVDHMITVFKDDYNQKVASFVETKFVDNILPFVEETQAKVIFSVSDQVALDVLAYHQEKADPRYNFFKSQRELVEFMDPRVNKEVGLEWFCDTHGISLKNVMSFGDNDNDYEMVKAAGLGIAMDNATDHVKSVADHIAPSNDDMGVYKFLLDYLSN